MGHFWPPRLDIAAGALVQLNGHRTQKKMKIDTTSGDYDFTYLSLGAGVQSSALLVLACQGGVPKPDVAIFADTGDEPKYVYDYLKVLTAYAAPFGVEVVKAQKGVLSERLLLSMNGGGSAPSLPVFQDGGRGILPRQCTFDYKIAPILKKARECMAYKPRQRVKHKVRAMLGITLDEAQRMKPARERWVTNTWPLVDLSLMRDDCFGIIEEAGLPEPLKSACVYCPYHSDSYWQWMKDEHPTEFERAVVFDDAIRDMSGRGVNNPTYIHRSCVPLSEAVFNVGDPDQVDMFGNECEGMCGV